jgi:hypothetical protein
LANWQITVSGGDKRCGTADADYEAVFHEAVADVIPSFIELLEDNSRDVRLQSMDAIGKLANHGERQLEALRHS